MARIPFQEYHLFNVLKEFESKILPLDLLLRNYFRFHSAIGSKDRKFISDTIYEMVRWRDLLDYLCSPPISWEKRYEIYQQKSFLTAQDNSSIPIPIRASAPNSFFKLLEKHYGEEKAYELCLHCNTKAPITIRVNPLKTTREALYERLKEKFLISPTSVSELGLVFQKKINFSLLPEFKEGLFEVQDEASQIVSQFIDPRQGDQVLDFCAGAGGKTLGFAHKLQKTGQIYLHDPRLKALHEAKKRLKRAGIQNAQIVTSDTLYKKNLKNKMDWILTDVPCSGSGTYRRNPDLKWKFNETFLGNLIQDQRKIFQNALHFLHPEGQIVYATCSILPEENELQVDFFEKTHQLCLVKEPFHSFPTPNGMDGFFAATLKRK